MKQKFLVILPLVLLLTFCCGGVAVVSAAPAANFDVTDVLEDLDGAIINGKEFNTGDYPLNATGVAQLLQFSEYGFSLRTEYEEMYGLYLYFYNPSGKKLAADNNCVNMAVGYDETGTPNKYDNLTLEVLSVSHNNLLVKLKVTQSVDDIHNRVLSNPGNRRYDVAGVQIQYEGEINPTDYKVGGTWLYSGYGEGLAMESENGSTLLSTCSPLTVVDLDVEFTYYRSWVNFATADQLSTVYFSIDKSFDSQYDDLYSVQAEYYTYLTSPIFCVFDKGYFAESDLLIDYDKLWSDLRSQVGLTMDGTSGRSLYWDAIGDGIYYCAYNDKTIYNYNIEINKMAWLTQVTSGQNFAMSPDALLSYMGQYSASKDKTVLNKYSADLFADKYLALGGDSFTSGYRKIDLTNSGEDDFSLVGSGVKVDIWKLLFGNKQWSSELENIQPIVKVSYDDVKSLNDEEVTIEYFIAPEEVSTLRRYLESNKSKVTYLFRFSDDLYYTSSLMTSYGIGGVSGAIGFMVQQPVFLNFDVISLGYKKDGVVNVIPVVSNPKDFIGSAEAGQDIHDYLGDASLIRFLTVLFAAIIVIFAVLLVIWAVKIIFRKR